MPLLLPVHAVEEKRSAPFYPIRKENSKTRRSCLQPIPALPVTANITKTHQETGEKKGKMAKTAVLKKRKER